MVPGSCDQFTNPEEISALSKYLKQRRLDLEAETTLGKDTLEVYGRKDPKFLKETESLPDKLQILDQRESGEVSSLVSSKDWLDAGKDLEVLEKMREKLAENMPSGTRVDINPDNISQTLTGEMPSLPGQRNDDILLSQVQSVLAGQGLTTENLEQYRGIVPGRDGEGRETALSNFLDTINSGSSGDSGLPGNEERLVASNTTRVDINLDNESQTLSGIKPSLPMDVTGRDTLETLPGSKQTISDNRELGLVEHKEIIEATPDNSLDDKRINISDQRDNSLGSSRINLNDQRDNSLDDKRINISDQRDNSLGSHVETISDTRNTTLPDSFDPIIGTKDTELSDVIESLITQGDVELSEYRDNLSEIQSNELETGRHSIPGEPKLDSQLENYRDSLTDLVDQELPNDVVTITDNRSESLSDFVDVVNSGDDVDLSKEVVGRLGSETEITELPTKSLAIKDEIDNLLSDTREPLVGDSQLVNPELEDYRGAVPGSKEDKELENTCEEVPGETNDVDLPTERLAITDTKDLDLETYREQRNLGEEDWDESLEDTRLDFSHEEIDSLEDTRLDLNQESIESLEDTRLGLDREDDVESLEDTRLNISNVDEIDSLEDTRLEIRTDDIESLEDTKVSIVGDASVIDTKEESGESVNEIANLEETRLGVITDASSLDTKETISETAVHEIGTLEDTRLPLTSDMSEVDRKETSDQPNLVASLEDTKLQVIPDGSNLDRKETADSSNVHSAATLEDTRLQVIQDASILDRKETTDDTNVHGQTILEYTRIQVIQDQSDLDRKETTDQTNVHTEETLEDTRLQIVQDASLLDEKETTDSSNVHTQGTLEDTRLQIIQDDSPLDRKEEIDQTNVHTESQLEDTRLDIMPDDSVFGRLESTDDQIPHGVGQLEDTRLQIIEDDSQLNRKEVTGDTNVHESGQLEDTRLQIIEDASSLDRKETTDDTNVHTESQLEDTRLQIIQDASPLDRKEETNETNVHTESALEDTRLQIIKDESSLDRKETTDQTNVHTGSQLEDTRLQIIQDSSNLDRKEETDSTNVHTESQLEDTLLQIIQDQSDLNWKETTNETNVHTEESLENTRIQIVQDDSEVNWKEDLDDTNVHTQTSLENTRLQVIQDDSTLDRKEETDSTNVHTESQLENTRLQIIKDQSNLDRKEETNKTNVHAESQLEDTLINIIDDESELNYKENDKETDHTHGVKSLEETRLQIIEDDSDINSKETLDKTNVHTVAALEDTVIKEPEKKELPLENTVIKEPEKKELPLENTVIKEPTENNIDLSTKVIQKPSKKELPLETKVIKEPEKKELPLGDTVLERPSEKAAKNNSDYEGEQVSLENTVIKEPKKKELPLGDAALERPSEEAPKSDSTYSGESQELYEESDRIKLAEHKAPKADPASYVGEVTSLEDYIDNVLKPGEGESKVDTRANQKPVMTHEASEFYDEGADPIYRPRYKLPSHFNLGSSLNPSTYLRWGIEEAMAGIHGAGKQLLVDTALDAAVFARDQLERATDLNKDRLPGNELAGGIVGDVINGNVGNLVKKGVKALLGGGDGVDMSTPKNMPLGWKFGDQYSYNKQKGGSTTWTALSKKSINDNTPASDYKFKDEYKLVYDGTATTIEELCGQSPGSVRTVEDLFNYLRNSPYINAANKSTANGYNPLKVYTLDSNDHWEIIFEPFVGKENGYKSFLPPIEEINNWNEAYHGIKTTFDRWCPVSSFELTKAKLTNKSIGLYDGEFSIPSSMELTNEIRITFVDDQFKSWRNYFERCVECSVYASEVHEKADYEGGGSYTRISKLDTKYVVIAPWKNVTFRATIYCMTPQYSTINKYDLLLILKDFVEERSGETDATGSDLTVTFSIVGENPSLSRTQGETAKRIKTNLTQKNDSDIRSANSGLINAVGSALGKGANSIMKLL